MTYYIYKFERNGMEDQLVWDDFVADWWDEYMDNEHGGMQYVADDKGVMAHSCIKSCMYDDMTGYQDSIQEEDKLDNRELYVVCYYQGYLYYNNWEIQTMVDFGVTKDEIIKNILDNKYVEGADIFTIGQVMKTTRDWIEAGKPINW